VGSERRGLLLRKLSHVVATLVLLAAGVALGFSVYKGVATTAKLVSSKEVSQARFYDEWNACIDARLHARLAPATTVKIDTRHLYNWVSLIQVGASWLHFTTNPAKADDLVYLEPSNTVGSCFGTKVVIRPIRVPNGNGLRQVG
jgi:hypothetical protein